MSVISWSPGMDLRLVRSGGGGGGGLGVNVGVAEVEVPVEKFVGSKEWARKK